jgi:aflatoxin B1 aldehyde reductase
MGMGGTINLNQTREVFNLFQKSGFNELDTALMYQSGKTEKLLGELGVSTFTVAGKANPWFDLKTCVSTNEPAEGLHPNALKKQLSLSLEALRLPKVNIFYLHAPDHSTPILDTLLAINELHKQNLFDEWGLSNFASWQVVHIYHLCKANQIQPPTVYQGMYNCITRDVEKELFPALRLCGMRFYAYNPLAGGILTGRYKEDDDPANGRFSNKTVWGQKYRQRFWKKEIFEAVKLIESSCEKHNVSLLQASLSWIYFHSALSPKNDDGVIIGGSSVDQIRSNLETITQLKSLPEDLVKTIDDAWVIAAPVCQKYFR